MQSVLSRLTSSIDIVLLAPPSSPNSYMHQQWLFFNDRTLRKMKFATPLPPLATVVSVKCYSYTLHWGLSEDIG